MSVKTIFEYDVTVTVNDKVNAGILKSELEAADSPALTVPVDSVVVEGTTIIVTLEGNATDADETVVDTVVAAHEGDDFVPVPAFEIQEAQSDDSADPGVEVTKASLNVGPLPTGLYLVGWFMECYLASASTTSRVQGRVFVSKNGDTPAERGECNNNQPIPYAPLSGSFPMQVTDGETISLSLRFQQLGAVDNTARARRARLSCIRLNG